MLLSGFAITIMKGFEPMGESALSITSDERLEDIESHFKVIAGPGAGKTHWLVEHIKNVLFNSTKISNVSKISCITYTTVGAEEVKKRLKNNLDKVDVSTIHSFLYSSIVKPYVYLLKDDSGRRLVNTDEMNGHEENIATIGKIIKWQKEVKNGYIRNHNKLRECLEDLDWFHSNDSLTLKPRKDFSRKIGRYWIRLEDLQFYKQLFWDEGIIHHEDVLYFSYKILKEFPILLEHISAKYPYMFLDEFQDTNPIQSEIIKWLGLLELPLVLLVTQHNQYMASKVLQELISLTLICQVLKNIGLKIIEEVVKELLVY